MSKPTKDDFREAAVNLVLAEPDPLDGHPENYRDVKDDGFKFWPCQVCGALVIEQIYDICEVCDWEDDPCMVDGVSICNFNKSLKDAQAEWKDRQVH